MLLGSIIREIKKYILVLKKHEGVNFDASHLILQEARFTTHTSGSALHITYFRKRVSAT